MRDKTLPKTEYKGRPTEASDPICPCRPCYNAHDCGHYGPTVKGHTTWVVVMSCASRWNYGCPYPKPLAEHVYVSARGTVCKRCGERKPGRITKAVGG